MSQSYDSVIVVASALRLLKRGALVHSIEFDSPHTAATCAQTRRGFFDQPRDIFATHCEERGCGALATHTVKISDGSCAQCGLVQLGDGAFIKFCDRHARPCAHACLARHLKNESNE